MKAGIYTAYSIFHVYEIIYSIEKTITINRKKTGKLSTENFLINTMGQTSVQIFFLPSVFGRLKCIVGF